MNFKGKKVFLRAIEKEDISLLQKWSNDPEINYMLGGWHFPSSVHDQEKWFNNLSASSLNQRFAVETMGDGLIGMANLVDINWKDRNGFHGILLGDKNIRGKGFGQDVVMAIMRYSFEELGLQRLNTTIIEYNLPSIKVYTTKCGWSIEGEKKQSYFRKNQWWSQLVLGITRNEYFEFVQKNKYWDEEV